MKPSLNILSLEDNANDAELLTACLRSELPGCHVQVVRDGKSFEAEVVKKSFDCVVADYMIPGYDGLEALAYVRKQDRNLPFIFFTGALGEELAIESFRRGATDCVRKEAIARLGPAVRRCLQEAGERQKLRLAEEALRRTELQYRTLFDQSPDAIVVIDPETTLAIDFNDEACHQLDYSREEFARLRVADYAATHTPEQIQATIASTLKHKRAEFQSGHRTRTGEVIDVWVIVRTIEMDGREVFYSIWRDVSEQKRAKAELERREEYFRALTEMGSDLVTVLSSAGRVRYVSPSVTRVLGYEPEALAGRNVLEVLHPDDSALTRDALQRVTANEKWSAKVEVRVRHMDGRWRVLEVVGQNLLHNPNVAGVIVSAWDLTERKLAETRIREQAELLDKAQDAILVCDLSTTIRYWNQSAERVYGWSAQEAVGKTADQLLFPAQDVQPISAFKGLIAKGEWHGELQQHDRNGRELVVESRWSLVRGEKGEPQSILIINTDVTDNRQLQARFLRAQRMESIGALAGGIAHDLNNVLAPVLMAAELLQEKVTDAECRKWLDTLSESAKRGADLIRQILSFARGTGEELVDLQLRHLIDEHTKILKETLPRSITIESFVDPGLWLVQGNATKLSQVLMNLSVNARDAMPTGGHMRFRARNFTVDQMVARARPGLKPGPYVVMSVADTGTGIPHDILSRIFEPFFTTKDVTKGTGLGLATALGIIKSHEGVLTVSSEEGKGTQFDAYLPASSDRGAVEVASEKMPLPHGAGEWVLVVDDEAPGREMIAATLRTHGFEVLSAQNGLEALDLFRANQKRIQLVLTDMAMPVMDGPSLVRALRATHPKIKVLVLSGMVDQLTVAWTACGPETHLLEKPCTAEDLLQSVHRSLRATGG